MPTNVKITSYRSMYILSESELRNLKEMLSDLYLVNVSSIAASSTTWKYASVQIQSKQIGSYKSRSNSSSIILADWKLDAFGVPLLSCTGIDVSVCTNIMRAARINCFLQHNVTIEGSVVTHLVSLSWYQSHPKLLSLGKPLTVWCHNLFEPSGKYSLVPVQLVKHRTVSLVDAIDGENVLIVCACVENF